MKINLTILLVFFAIFSCKKEDYRDKFEGTYSGVYHDIQSIKNANLDVVKLNNNEISIYRNSTHLCNAEVLIDGTFETGNDFSEKHWGYFKLDSLYYYNNVDGLITFHYFNGKKK